MKGIRIDMGKLDGKVALITGGGTGIGKGIALEYVREGADIAICGRRLEELNKAAGEIQDAGGRCTVIQGDISVETDVIWIVSETIERLGGLHILVNNASVVGQVAPVDELVLDQWEYALRVNLTGTMLCCREAVRHMKKQKHGIIVNVSSNVGRRGFPNRAPYVCSKWAMHGLGQTLALEVAQYGIRVNTICPGPVLTERLEGSMEKMAKARGVSVEDIEMEWYEESPMGRFATIEECAKVAMFLSCDDSSAMTGQALNVTAGMMMT